MFPLNFRGFDKFPCKTFGSFQESLCIFLKSNLQLTINYWNGWRFEKSYQFKGNIEWNQLSITFNLSDSFLKAKSLINDLMQIRKERFLQKVFDFNGKKFD